jgi:hypothetical protein
MRIVRAVSGLGLAVAASCLGIACVGDSSAPADGRAAATSFLDEIRAGRVEPAWRATTVEFKSLMGLDSLRDYVRAHPALKGKAEFLDGRTVKSSGPELAEYTFRAIPPPPAKARGRGKKAGPAQPASATIRVTTAREDGTLKVERLAIE